jgi:hypothetical protein
MFKFARPTILLASIVGVWIAFSTFGARPVAASFTYPHYDVDITVNQDSTVDVTETLTYNFVGTYHGVTRDITLSDAAKERRCVTTGLTCGGFERIALIGLYGPDGRAVTKDQYELSETTNEDTDQRYYSIKWTVWPQGKTFGGGEDFTWTIKYRLYGSLGWIGQSTETANPYLYWNMLPENRGGSVDSSRMTINFPDSVTPNKSTLEVYADYSQPYTAITSGRSLVINTSDLPSYSNFTVAYKLPIGSILRPAHLSFTSGLPMIGTRLTLDGIDLGDVSGALDNFPSGNHQLEFSYPGYTSKVLTVNVKPEEKVQLDASLTPTAGMWIIIIGDLILNGLGLIVFPIGAYLIYRQWQHKGQDVGKVPTVIPLFHPPENMAPYLVGSLKDERVDRQDVTGSIIDLAYRGYIKISEITQGRNYILTKLDGKKGDPGLNTIESELMDAIFGGKDSVQTATMGTTFAAKYPKLVRHIYDELVTRGYFTSSPQFTRMRYMVGGAGILILGSLITFFAGIGALFVVGFPGPILLGLAFLVLGIILMIVANYMPAKTAEGSKVYNQILGFRMYLYTAERYRLQGLKPEEFEKYLSYAIVFNIEKQWAQKFKDIYKGKPDWYEGNGDIIWDAYWVSRFTRSFSNAMVSRSFTNNSGSGHGSGWSGGGGSFGGFSGGGGGGGGSGAF